MSWSEALAHLKRPADLVDELLEFAKSIGASHSGHASHDLTEQQHVYQEKMHRAVREIKDLRQALRQERHLSEELRRQLDEANRKLDNPKNADTNAWLHS